MLTLNLASGRLKTLTNLTTLLPQIWVESLSKAQHYLLLNSFISIDSDHMLSATLQKNIRRRLRTTIGHENEVKLHTRVLNHLL